MATSSTVVLLVLLVLVATLSQLNQVTAFVPATPRGSSLASAAKMMTAVWAKPASSKEEDLELTRKVIQSHLESDTSSSSSSSDQKTATATTERTEEN
jgi:hypothetical protein